MELINAFPEIEAARQLVQLSGGDDGDDVGVSVTALSSNGVGRRKEQNGTVVDETSTVRAAEGTEKEEEEEEEEEGIRQPRKRRRRLRSLAEIYKVTKPMTTRPSLAKAAEFQVIKEVFHNLGED